MQTPGSTSSSVSSPPPQADADVDTAHFRGHQALSWPPSAACGCGGDPVACAAARTAQGGLPGGGGCSGAAGGGGGGRRARRHQGGRRVRLRRILELYVTEAWQSWLRRSRAQHLYRKLQAMAKEERAGQQKMSAACKKFNRVTAASRGNDEYKNENTT